MSRSPCGCSDRILQEKLKLILFTMADLLKDDGEPKCTSGIPNLVHDVVRFGRLSGHMYPGVRSHDRPRDWLSIAGLHIFGGAEMNFSRVVVPGGDASDVA